MRPPNSHIPTMQNSERMLTDEVPPVDIDLEIYSPVMREQFERKSNKDKKSTRKNMSRSRSNRNRSIEQ